MSHLRTVLLVGLIMMAGFLAVDQRRQFDGVEGIAKDIKNLVQHRPAQGPQACFTAEWDDLDGMHQTVQTYQGLEEPLELFVERHEVEVRQKLKLHPKR